jgi:hypothetical protein
MMKAIGVELFSQSRDSPHLNLRQAVPEQSEGWNGLEILGDIILDWTIDEI